MSLEPLLLRLLLLHEAVVGYGSLDFNGVLQRAKHAAEWIFEDGKLEVVRPEAAIGLPARGRVPGGYGAYFPGPPEPLYLRLAYPKIDDATELRIAALFVDHLLAALEGAGYREELERQARIDWLTGLGSRRFLERRVQEGLGEGWGLALLDLDGLKQVNDTQGHLAGDRLLKALAESLRRYALEAYRLAGDEFVVVLSREDIPRLHRALEGFAVSYGVSWAEEAQGEALLALADARMYQQKRSRGRDR
ncbi:GGDEF domain-containing protein [Meiothermus ruber]|uniref:GGDEF domain-containing protein n=1 Tax=Meiothermus ruber TaxID=277 RepID=UPI0005601276|nr:GGDEF domain-containing protein [Meiothermus ruber]